MSTEQDVFGFDELAAAFQKIESKYPGKADAVLMAQGRIAVNKVKARTPTGKTKKLRGSWRLKKPKKYGKATVARIQSNAPHAHLVELGHEQVRGGRVNRNGQRLNRVQRAVRGIKTSGRVEGKHMLEETMKEMQGAYTKAAEKLLDDLTRDVQT